MIMQAYFLRELISEGIWAQLKYNLSLYHEGINRVNKKSSHLDTFNLDIKCFLITS
jgi:hypothetical protein